MKNLTTRLGTPLVVAAALSAYTPQQANAVTVGLDGVTPNMTFEQQVPTWYKVSFEDEEGRRFLPTDGHGLQKEGYFPVLNKMDCTIDFPTNGEVDTNEETSEFDLVQILTNQGEPIDFNAYALSMQGGLPQINSHKQVYSTTDLGGIEQIINSLKEKETDIDKIEIEYCDNSLDLIAYSANPDLFDQFLNEGKGKIFDFVEIEEEPIYNPFLPTNSGIFESKQFENRPESVSNLAQLLFPNTGGDSSLIFRPCDCSRFDDTYQPPHIGNGIPPSNGEHQITVPPIPIPAPALLLLTGLGALGYVANRRRKQN